MKTSNQFDVIIVGGSYAGLSAAMALGRALKKVLVIDSGKPCNRQTPHSHNFITHDGRRPREIAVLAKEQVQRYDSVQFLDGLATSALKTGYGFEVTTDAGDVFAAKKVIFATGIKDIMPDIEGAAECWGISLLHCPYCHGYEVRNEKTGVLGNGPQGFELASLISNWTKDLTLFTNGKSTLSPEETWKLESHGIAIIETEVVGMEHTMGYLQHLVFRDGNASAVKALYTRNAFEQHCTIPQALGCALTEDGYLIIDSFQKTTVEGVYACGDNTSRMRTVSNAVAMGTMAAMMASREMIYGKFNTVLV